jgi:hypothetical protein
MKRRAAPAEFYRRPFTDTRLWTPERSGLAAACWARYAAFDNLFL